LELESNSTISDRTYGRDRVQAELRDMELCVNHKRIARLMKLATLRGVSRRRGYVVTTQRDRQAQTAPDLVKRQFKSTGINQLWVAFHLLNKPNSLNRDFELIVGMENGAWPSYNS